MSSRRAIVALVVVCVSLVVPGAAYACRCTTPSLAEAMKRADAAFVATVTSVDGHGNYVVTVEGAWKGDVPKTVTIHAGSGTGDCSYGSLGKTKRWVFFARGGDASYAIRLCGGTMRATTSALARVTKLFGAPKAPT